MLQGSWPCQVESVAALQLGAPMLPMPYSPEIRGCCCALQVVAPYSVGTPGQVFGLLRKWVGDEDKVNEVGWAGMRERELQGLEKRECRAGKRAGFTARRRGLPVWSSARHFEPCWGMPWWQCLNCLPSLHPTLRHRALVPTPTVRPTPTPTPHGPVTAGQAHDPDGRRQGRRVRRAYHPEQALPQQVPHGG